MDTRLEQTVRMLQGHWIALAGIAAFALLGAGTGKALSPGPLYEAAEPARLISGPAVETTSAPEIAWPAGKLPVHVIGTDQANPPPLEPGRLPSTEDVLAAYESAPSVYETASPAQDELPAYYHHSAMNADQLALERSFETLPAMAPG